MDPAEELKLITLITKAHHELEQNRAANASNSLIKLLEEELRELEHIFATGDADRLESRAFLDQCAEKFDND